MPKEELNEELEKVAGGADFTGREAKAYDYIMKWIDQNLYSHHVKQADEARVYLEQKAIEYINAYHLTGPSLTIEMINEIHIWMDTHK